MSDVLGRRRLRSITASRLGKTLCSPRRGYAPLRWNIVRKRPCTSPRKCRSAWIGRPSCARPRRTRAGARTRAGGPRTTRGRCSSDRCGCCASRRAPPRRRPDAVRQRLEDRAAEVAAGEERARARGQTEAGALAEAQESLRVAESQISCYAEGVVVRRIVSEEASSRGSVWTRCLRTRTPDEVQRLCGELQQWTEQARQREAEAARGAEEESSAVQALAEARRSLQEEEATVAQQAQEVQREFQRREREVQEEQQAVALQQQQQRIESQLAAAEEAVFGPAVPASASSSSVGPPPGAPRMQPAIALVPDLPLTVRIPHFELVRQSLLGTEINYTIVVEGLGTTETIVRQFSQFRELHTRLSQKPFAYSLRSLPQDWLFSHFSNSMLERQRRQLETYLDALCSHSQVVLDPEGVLWRWLAVDDFTQVIVRLVAARAAGSPEELQHLTQTLEAVVAVSDDATRCVHPVVLGILKEVLLGDVPEAAQAAARLLEQLLVTSRRARQLFLSRDSGGAEALLAASRGSGGSVAASAVQRVFETLCNQDADGGDGPQASEGDEAEAAGRASPTPPAVGEQEPSECCVCLDRPKSHAMLPCGHLCACMECAAQLSAQGQSCPVCRQRVERTVQIYT
mmetsp:Transcript_46164/g.147463  ORF Transcript_46164/g.147463 Transcript_46164/m.147463 type:complete len:629 (-) Transcript_46164:86-1972(-)